MERLNCWEFMHCGREPGGARVNELGICPAATSEGHDRLNRGQNGGRMCWHVAGTLCRGEVQGSFARKFENCHECEFYLFVQHQEERHFAITPIQAVFAGPVVDENKGT